MGLSVCVRAADLIHGAVDYVSEGEGWVRPVRFTPAQMRALGSVRAWHPGYYRQLAACTSGVTLEFETDAASVSVELRMGRPPRGTVSVLADVTRAQSLEAPFDGASADVDGRHLPLCVPDEDNVVTFSLDDPAAAPEPGIVRLPLPGMGENHRVRVWLPCLAPCAVREVRADGTYLNPVADAGRLLVIGDSIAQGYVSRDPGLSWTALLAGQLGLELLNQGVGGQVFQPGSLADLPSLLTPEAIVVELGENYRYEPCSASRVALDVKALLGEVSEAWPDVPTWVLTPLPHLECAYPTHPRSCADAVPSLIEECAAKHEQMRLVDGTALLDADSLETLICDGSDHPGPDGHRMIAERLSFVMGATKEDGSARRERALELASARGEAALPMVECLRRGRCEVLLAEEGAIVVEVEGPVRLVMGPSRKALRRALEALGTDARVTMVCGGRSLARDVAWATGGHARKCHVVSWPQGKPAPEVDPSLDIRVLTSAYAEAVRRAYEHPEYFSPGELERALDAGAFLGAFEENRLVGFVGEHAEGCMGALEVLEGHRRKGWGSALAKAKIAQLIERGAVPWAEVWPDNAASLALERSLGLVVRPADEFWVVA